MGLSNRERVGRALKTTVAGRRVLREFIDFYNTRRPHQSLNQQSPVPRADLATTGNVERRQKLGRIINDYHRASDITTAACLA